MICMLYHNNLVQSINYENSLNRIELTRASICTFVAENEDSLRNIYL